MPIVLIIASCILALAWVPVAFHFNKGWKVRRNPVSLAIWLMVLFCSYTNILFVLALLDQTSWQFFSLATHAVDMVILINFYLAFHWEAKKFGDQRIN